MLMRSSSSSASTMARRTPRSPSVANDSAIAPGPARTRSKGTRPTSDSDWRASTRTRLGSVMGVSGWSCMPLSCSRASPTKRWPLNTLRRFLGNAGQAMVKSVPSAAISASATGPMLPASVESKVEQYLKKNWRQPAASSHWSAASDCATASAAGMVRDLRAITTASASTASAGPAGTPIICTARMPARTRVPARSVAPVKSSAMQPNIALTRAVPPCRSHSVLPQV